MSYGSITIGNCRFEVVSMRLEPRTIVFECAALLPGGTVVRSPETAIIREPEGAIVYSYTYDQNAIWVPPGPPVPVRIVQTISFIPDGPRRADMWRDRAPIAGLDGPRRPLGRGGQKEIGR